MTGTVSGAQLRAFIERIERLEEEKRTIAHDVKEVKAEAKGSGYDVGTINAILKLRKKDQAERDEEQAMLDLYMSALGMLPLFEAEASQSYSEAKGRGAVKDSLTTADPETGELTDNQESGASTEVRETEAVSPSAGTVKGFASAVSPASDESEQGDVGATASSINPHSQVSSSQPADTAGGVIPSAPPATHSDPYDPGEIPAFLRRDGYPKREAVEAV